MRPFEVLVIIILVFITWNVKQGFTMIVEQLKITNELLKRDKL